MKISLRQRQSVELINRRSLTLLLAFTKRWRQMLPVSIATLMSLGLLYAGACQPLENLVYDALFQHRGALPWSPQVVVVEMDEPSLREVGYLGSRYSLAALVDRLADAHPAVIVLDILLSPPQSEDAQLAQAIARQGKVILAQGWDSQDRPLPLSPQLQTAAIALGHIQVAPDADGLVRSVAPQINNLAAVGVAAAQVYAAHQLSVSLPAVDRPLWVNWLAPTATFPNRYSLTAVLQGQIPSEAFRDKIVLVGVVTPEVETLHTPFDHTPPTHRVYLDATVISNLLQQNALHRSTTVWILLAGVVALGALSCRRFLHQIVAWLALCIGWGVLGVLLFRGYDWIPIATPMLWLGLCAAGTATGELLHTHLLLRRSEARYALAVRAAHEGLWDWDLRTDRIYFSPRWQELLGYCEAELSDRPQEWFSRVHPLDLEALRLAIENHIRTPSTHFEYEYRLRHRDGTYHWMLCRGMAVRPRRGEVQRLVGSQADITQRKHTEAELRQSAFYDRLTGLPNRTSFSEHLQQAITNFQRLPIAAFAVLWLDLDQFKIVNNSLGSVMGDRLLVAVSQRLKAFLPPEDIIARLSGDEFAILHSIQDTTDVTRMAERVQQVLALPFNLDGHEVYATASIGIALSASHYTQADHVLRDADTAMHRAKAQGRAQYQVFDRAMRTHMLARLRMENDLRRAIAQGEREVTGADLVDADRVDTDGKLQELQLYYQPVICFTTGLIIGFEALVRWQHPDQGFLSPAYFIPMAEESGLIVPLGWWILRTACRQMRQWQSSFPDQSFLSVSVNLSSQQFSMTGLIEHIRQILRETHLDAAHLKLEMTESTVMENAASVVEVLHQLRRQGIHLAIDDFGTGYSSLSYLPRFPIDSLKIDRSFVSRMGDCDDSLEVVRTILALAHNLGMDVTAEGVESPEQANQLVQMDCEYGQGFLFSRPVDAGTATQLLAKQQV